MTRVWATIWMIGVVILTGSAVFQQKMISAVLAVAYAVVMLAFEVRHLGERLDGEP